MSSLRCCFVWLPCTVSVKQTGYHRTFCLIVLCNKNAQVHIVNCNNFIKLTKIMETKELHSNIEHKIRLELEIASMKELVLGLLKEKKGSYETMHRNYTISSILAITP